METKHTPGPWRVGDAGHTVFGPPRADKPCPEIIAQSLRIANARRIVQCVNAHDALVEAVEAAIQTIRTALKLANPQP